MENTVATAETAASRQDVEASAGLLFLLPGASVARPSPWGWQTLV